MGYELLEVELVFDDLKERIEKTKASLNNEFKSMRAGRANAHILDRVEFLTMALILPSTKWLTSPFPKQECLLSTYGTKAQSRL